MSVQGRRLGAAALGVPAVLIGRQPNPGYPAIGVDNRAAGIAAAHLWRLGHRRFAYLTALSSWYDFQERGKGTLSFLHDTGETFELTVLDRIFGEADAYRSIMEACAHDLIATAYVASTDRHARGALAALADLGYRVPEDASVLGFDDYVTSQFVRPALTTMKMPSAEMGRLAVHRLLDLLGGRDVMTETLLEATLVERDSTGVPRYP